MWFNSVALDLVCDDQHLTRATRWCKNGDHSSLSIPEICVSE